MAPISNTIFAVSLFFALVALSLWAKRRRRVSESARRAMAAIRASLND
jgi:hypothetical protein